ncbi:Putative tartrate dehydrogenase (subunit 1) [Bacillus velezensis]|nr:Putative tartrate dehydrogenase (subunit 1) [Bacillus velezensis]
MGKEAVPQAERVLNAIAELHGGIAFEFTSFPRSCEYYLEHGTMMPDDG